MKALIIKTAICGGLGALGGYLSAVFGGWTGDLTTLAVCMVIDVLTGVTAAMLCKSPKTPQGALASRPFAKGCARKIVTLLLVAVAYRIDLTLGTDYIRSAAVIAFTAAEIMSIIENAGLIGIPMPNVLLKAVEVLKTRDSHADN